MLSVSTRQSRAIDLSHSRLYRSSRGFYGRLAFGIYLLTLASLLGSAGAAGPGDRLFLSCTRCLACSRTSLSGWIGVGYWKLWRSLIDLRKMA